jgi:hypothetical protein
MKRLSLLLPTIAILLASCGGGTMATTPATTPITMVPITPPTTYRAYAVTSSALYSLVLSGPGNDEKRAALNTTSSITDLAWDGTNLYAVTFSSLIRIDTATGAVTTVGSLGAGGINALTADSKGDLYGASTGGTLYKINKATGASAVVGPLGFGSSGDLAFTADGALYATVKQNTFTTDALARVDVATGKATIIGDTGYADVYGLNVQGGVMYALTVKGQLLTLNPASARATFIRDTTLDFTGMQ